MKMQCAIILLSAFAVLCFASSPPIKSSWPELVGKTGEEAKAVILKENPYVTKVEILLEGSGVTMDYRQSRVRIFVNDEGIVAETPRTG